jgi:very-short-patch-repair endonuclease
VPVPKKLSLGEETFQLHCHALLAMDCFPVREFKFAKGRKWAFDFAWPDMKTAVEVEGGTAWGKSRHSRGDGFERDCRKYNAAASLGWRVFRFSTEMVVSGEAINFIKEIL